MNKSMDERPTRATDRSHHAGKSGHGWMMIVCCIPMLLIAVVSVAAGVVSAGFLVAALACIALMALMMRGTGRGGGTGRWA